MKLYSTSDAARYLGLSTVTMEYHLYVSRDLKADQKIGRTLVFTQGTLDSFRLTKRRPGRPKAHEPEPPASHKVHTIIS